MGWKDKIKIAVFGYRATSISYIEHLKKIGVESAMMSYYLDL